MATRPIRQLVRFVLFSLLVAALVRGGIAASRYVGQAVRVQPSAGNQTPPAAPRHVRPIRVQA